MIASSPMFVFFFLNDPAPTEFYPLPLHAALPIYRLPACLPPGFARSGPPPPRGHVAGEDGGRDPQHHGPERQLRPVRRPGGTVACRRGQPLDRSEEHTSELQSRLHLVCRLLLEKK